MMTTKRRMEPVSGKVAAATTETVRDSDRNLGDHQNGGCLPLVAAAAAYFSVGNSISLVVVSTLAVQCS